MIIRHCLFTHLLCCIAVVLPAFAGVGSPQPAITSGRFGQLPAYFEKNLGQADKAVLYTSRAAGYTLSLTDKGAQFALAGKRIALVFAGANSRANVTPEDPLEGRSNYYFGKDPQKWLQNVPQFGSVRYRDLYPGVDLTWYSKGKQLEYDLVLDPGADPSRIRLRFDGADSIGITPGGDIVFGANGSEFRQLKPTVWQKRVSERVSVGVEYVLLSKNEVGVHLANYDHSLPLDIDPVLRYSTFLSGSGDNYPMGIAVDSSGSAYVTGSTTTSDFPGTSGAGGLFVARLNTLGTGIVYVTYFGGTTNANFNAANGIAVDGSGNAYITGAAFAADFPVTPGAFRSTKEASNGDAFVLKFGPSGELVWGTYLGGSDADYGAAIAVDGSGTSYVAGSTQATDFPTTSGACIGRGDVFVVTLNTAGSALLNATCLGAERSDPRAIVLDSQLNVYVAGDTQATNMPTTQGACQSSLKGVLNAFVAKLTSGSVDYLTYLGGDGNDGATSIAVDAGGDAYVAGAATSADFPTTVGAFERSKPTPSNFTGFVAKLNPAGMALMWSTYLGGSSSDGVLGILVDASGNAWLTGHTSSRDFPTTPGAFFTPMITEDNDVFVAQLSADGTTLAYSGRIGSTGMDLASGLARDNNGALYITGLTTSLNYPTTPGVYESSPPARDNVKGFITKVDMNSTTRCTVSLSSYEAHIPGHGGSGSFDVKVPEGCPWEAVAWPGVTLGSVTHGTSSATVSYSMPPSENMSGAPMPSYIKVGPATYTINQDLGSCTDPGLTPGSLTFANSGGAQDINVALPSGCPHNSTASAGWIQITFGANSKGSGIVTISVGLYNSGRRFGTITIAGKTVPVTQGSGLGATLTLNKVGNGTVIATPAPVNGVYAPGTKVCLVAKPALGWQFGSWSGTALDSSGCVIMNANASVTAPSSTESR